jgi:ubiquinone/menaquinone biosynthesis C-methylase UbiE
MLDVARDKLGIRAALHQGDASHLPYDEGTFDLVMVTLTLHEMTPRTRSAVLDEMKRVLRDSGRILVIDYHPGPLRFPKGWLAKGLITLIEFLAGREHFRNQRDFLGSGGAPALASRHGLHATETRIVTGGNLGLYLFSQE